MKKIYIKPVTESLPNQFRDYLMDSQIKTGSVFNSGNGGSKTAEIKGATNPNDIVTDGDGIGWGNARETSLWDDEPVEYSKGLW